MEAKFEPFEGVVAHCQRLNVREKPSTESQLVTTITEGTRVDVKRWVEYIGTEHNGWYYIEKPTKSKNIMGYVFASAIEPIVE